MLIYKLKYSTWYSTIQLHVPNESIVRYITLAAFKLLLRKWILYTVYTLDPVTFYLISILTSLLCHAGKCMLVTLCIKFHYASKIREYWNELPSNKRHSLWQVTCNKYQKMSQYKINRHTNMMKDKILLLLHYWLKWVPLKMDLAFLAF